MILVPANMSISEKKKILDFDTVCFCIYNTTCMVYMNNDEDVELETTSDEDMEISEPELEDLEEKAGDKIKQLKDKIAR
jgi:hypothetical protein